MSLNDARWSGGGVVFKASITIQMDDPVIETVSRATKIGERPSLGLRRCLNRYMEIMNRTEPPPGEMVSLLNTVTAHVKGFMHRIEYPTRQAIAQAVDQSTLTPEQRARLLTYLERISYAEYAKLIEAVEMMRG